MHCDRAWRLVGGAEIKRSHEEGAASGHIMRLTIIGCGDAFGAGGQLQTSFHVRSDRSTFLIDCGTSTLIGMRRLGLATNDIDMVCVTHLHGDHFGGLPWLLIDAQYASKRTRPLVITGPRGTEARFMIAAEALGETPGPNGHRRGESPQAHLSQDPADPLFFDGADVSEWPARLEDPPNRRDRTAFGGRGLLGRKFGNTGGMAAVFQVSDLNYYRRFRPAVSFPWVSLPSPVAKSTWHWAILPAAWLSAGSFGAGGNLHTRAIAA